MTFGMDFLQGLLCIYLDIGLAIVMGKEEVIYPGRNKCPTLKPTKTILALAIGSYGACGI